MAGYIVLLNWDRFQHYKDRDPPWVKLYRDLLTSESWLLGNDESRLVQVASVLIAARYSNRIPYRYDLIKKVSNLDMDEKKFMRAVEHLSATNFLEIQEDASSDGCPEHLASNPLAKCSSEKRREETEESQTRARATPDAKAQGEADPPPGLDPAAWSRWREYRIEIRKPLKPVSIPAAQRELAAFGGDQAAVVEQSIAQGWQGLFALKGRPKTPQLPVRRELPDAFEVARRGNGG